MVNNSTNDEFGKPFVLLTVLLTIIFICTAAMVSLVLLFVTNDWSVSVMLAQRWNPVSYAATYFITALCHFASAWVCAVYIMREMQGHGDPEWKICCSALSFIFIALSQLFPPANSMKPVDLGLGGLNVAFAVVDVNNEEVIPTLIPFSIGKEYLSTVIHIALRLTGKKQSCIIMHTFEKLMRYFCYLLFSGSIMGYAVIFNFLSNNSDLLHFNLVLSLGMVILSLVLEVVALIAMVAMMAGSAPRHERDRYKRTFFGLEACFLYCMIIGVVLTVMAESSLFKHYKG